MSKFKLDDVIDFFLHKKVVLTPSRILIIKILSKHSKPRSAYQLQSEINLKRHTKLNISTIYRVLNFWINQGFIHRIASLNKYVICLRPHEQHTHMLNYCIKCEKVIESCNQKMNLNFKESAARLDLSFHNSSSIEIPVICPSCS